VCVIQQDNTFVTAAMKAMRVEETATSKHFALQRHKR